MKQVHLDFIAGVFVVKPKETVTGIWSAEEVGELREVLEGLVSKGSFDVVVSLRGLRILDSSIWGVLINNKNGLASRGQHLVLCDLSKSVMEHIAKISFHFNVYRNVEEAAAAMKRKAPAGEDAKSAESREETEAAHRDT